MVSKMDRRLVFSIGYAKPQPPSVDRYLQVAKLGELHCQGTGEGIDLVHIWTGVNQYNWNAVNPDVGMTYDAAVDLSLSKGLVVFGGIGTTPWWALTLFDSGTASSGTPNTLTDNTKNWSTDQWDNDNYSIKIVAGTGAGQIRPIESNTATVITIPSEKPWDTIPDNTSQYEIKGRDYEWPPHEAYATAFQNCCQEIASHFEGRIQYWSYWNEPNANGWHEVNPAEYTTWLKRAHDGIKAGNPHALIAIGGLDIASSGGTGWSTNFLQNVYDYIINTLGQNPDDYFDAVGLHLYEWQPNLPGVPPINIAGVEAHRTVMVNRGDSEKSIWANEYGWDMNPDKVPAWTEQQQASWLQGALELLSSASRPYIASASHLILYDTDGTKFGLISAGQAERQAYGTFRDYAAPRTPRWESRAPFITQV